MHGSSSSSSFTLAHNQVEIVIEKKSEKPEWLEAFLERTYFDCCLEHPFRKNELNKYCINCNMSTCQYCMSYGTHRQHSILKIYRHVYKDVVSLDSMEKYINCSQIQPYKCNKRLVIALNPLPHSRSTLLSNTEALCDSCNRRLTEPTLYRYCSIACKVMAYSRKPSHSVPPFLLVNPKQEMEALRPQKPLHKRKGMPSRAPFF